MRNRSATSFRERMIQAHLLGERGRALRTARVFREISRCQVYHKTAHDLRWISLEQLATWMKVPPNVGPSGQRNFYSFLNEYRHAVDKLRMHGFLNWGKYNNGWVYVHVDDADPTWTLFELTESGSRFLKECPADMDIIRGMGMWRCFE